MWHQPEIRLMLSPSPPVAGQEVMLDTLLRIEKRTRIDEVEVRLLGYESFAVSPGHAAAVMRPFVDLRARFAPLVLEPGEHRLRSRFALPAGEMGAYVGQSVRVVYEATVQARIPWWFDAKAAFALPVQTAPLAAGEPRKAVMFASRVEGPVDGQTYAELSLERNVVAAGEVLQGALSMIGAPARTQRVRLDLQLHEGVDLPPEMHWAHGASVDLGAVRTLGVVLHEGRPTDGEAMAFKLQLPSDLTPTTKGRAVKLWWRVVVRAEVSFGSNFEWSVPLTVEPGAARERGRPQVLEPVPLVGHERRAKLWQQAAAQLGLETTAGREQMTGEEATGRFTLRLEAGPKGERVATARIEWPAIVGDVELRERRWSDALGSDVRSLDESFDARFAVRADRDEVLEALLAPEIRARLLALGEVHLDEEGARLVAPVDVRSTEALVASLAPLATAARMLCAGRDMLPAAGGSPYR